MRSLKDPRGAIWVRGCDGASSLGTTGTSILGGGGGAGSGGLNCDQPGGIICWANAAFATSREIVPAIRREKRFISLMS